MKGDEIYAAGSDDERAASRYIIRAVAVLFGAVALPSILLDIDWPAVLRALAAIAGI